MPTKNSTPTPAYVGKSIDLGTDGLYFGMSYSNVTIDTLVATPTSAPASRDVKM